MAASSKFPLISTGKSFATVKRIMVCAALLLVSLAIYLFYRTEATVVNGLAIAAFGKAPYEALRATVQHRLPLPQFVVFTLPQMLWTFCFTLLSGGLFIRFKQKKIHCLWIPLLVSTGLEVLQILPAFPGRFDWLDLLGAGFSWGLATLLLYRDTSPSENLFGRMSIQSFAFTACYAAMFLAHVRH